MHKPIPKRPTVLIPKRCPGVTKKILDGVFKACLVTHQEDSASKAVYRVLTSLAMERMHYRPTNFNAHVENGGLH